MKYQITEAVMGTFIEAFNTREEAEEQIRKYVEEDPNISEDFFEISTVGDVKALRLATDMSQAAFAREYGIPVRTLQNWESGTTVPPSYVYDLLERAVATHSILPCAYVLHTYRDKMGIGDMITFTDLSAALSYAADEWATLVKADKDSYKNDPAGRFDVTLQVCEYEDGEYIPTGETIEDIWSAF